MIGNALKLKEKFEESLSDKTNR